MTRPEYMSRETLAKALDIKPGAVDQLVKRGLLPAPITLGEWPRWCWQAVDDALRTRGAPPLQVGDEADDPYMRGAIRGTPALRVPGPQ